MQLGPLDEAHYLRRNLLGTLARGLSLTAAAVVVAYTLADPGLSSTKRTKRVLSTCGKVASEMQFKVSLVECAPVES